MEKMALPHCIVPGTAALYSDKCIPLEIKKVQDPGQPDGILHLLTSVFMKFPLGPGACLRWSTSSIRSRMRRPCRRGRSSPRFLHWSSWEAVISWADSAGSLRIRPHSSPSWWGSPGGSGRSVPGAVPLRAVLEWGGPRRHVGGPASSVAWGSPC